MAHELVDAFAQAGLPLCRTLRDMLDEHPDHCTERRGCGLTQATRFLSERVNRPRDPLDPADLWLFDAWPVRNVAAIAERSVRLGWAPGWRGLSDAPIEVVDGVSGLPGARELLSLQPRLAAIAAGNLHEESRLLLSIIIDLLSYREPVDPVLPAMADKPEIGSCSQAEEFFLEIAHGKIRRGGRANVLVDDAGQAVLVEKVGLGESHSAIFVRPASICGVAIPPGSLAALRYRDDVVPLASHRDGDILPLSALAQVRFLRFTTLVVSPKHRARAFGAQFRRQVLGNMMSPHSTTLDDLSGYAGQRLLGA